MPLQGWNLSPLPVWPWWLLFAIIVCLPDPLPAQHSDDARTGHLIVIDTIEIIGNRITKAHVILRELEFCRHDTVGVDRLMPLLEKSRENVFNMRVFNVVTMDTLHKGDPGHIGVVVTVTERWYIWPVPYMEIADRNFNTWWESRDFSRLTYGLDVVFYNMRGRNETMKLLGHFGYNQRFGLTYRIPYLTRQQKLGGGFGAAAGYNHEVAVKTSGDKPLYMKSDEHYLRKNVSAYTELTFRPGFYSTHLLRIMYNNFFFDDSVVAIPGFVVNRQPTQEFVTIEYFFKLDHRDIQVYPLNGYYLDATLSHSFPVDATRNSFLKVNARKYGTIAGRFHWAAGVTGRLNFTGLQPYFLQHTLGYGRDYVRGYEYYVVDGQHFGLLKSNLKWALLPQRIFKAGFIPTTKFNTIPLALYLNAFADAAYVYQTLSFSEDPAHDENVLPNTLLFGIGLGFDIVTFYDIIVRMEGSMNKMGEAGFFLHFVAPI